MDGLNTLHVASCYGLWGGGGERKGVSPLKGRQIWRSSGPLPSGNFISDTFLGTVKSENEIMLLYGIQYKIQLIPQF